MITLGVYPKVYHVGHAAISELFLDPVVIEEKVDGSQFSFGRFEEDGKELFRCCSHRKELIPGAPGEMFSAAVNSVLSRFHTLHPGWIYRCEYLSKPKHNTLPYKRIPRDYLVVFDVSIGMEAYLPPEEKRAEADRIGLEAVPSLFFGTVDSPEALKGFLKCESFLGGPIEGVVAKNYSRFGKDGRVLMGKYVDGVFREKHRLAWKNANPDQGGILTRLIARYKSKARWDKAVQHLRDDGQITDSLQDLGALIPKVQEDIAAEEADEIKRFLWEWAWPHVRRGAIKGLPEWYKEKLPVKQFGEK